MPDAENDAYQVVSDALMPFLNCDPHNHDPRSCPAVLAVMDALGAGSHPEHGCEVNGAILGPIDEWAGYRRNELAATHVRTVTTVRHEGPWTRVTSPGSTPPRCNQHLGIEYANNKGRVYSCAKAAGHDGHHEDADEQMTWTVRDA